jgi:glycosyltransferase involved in cell wall biosynthesis
MKVAIVHDWIINIGGAEKCLESIYSLYPLSDIYTLIVSEESAVSLGIDTNRITSSFIQKLPKAKRKYRNYLPFFPFAIEQFDLSDYDLVISSSHSVAKGTLTDSNQLHICYCHTPVRYAWDMYHQYMKDNGLIKGLKGKIARLVLHYIRIWDLATANRVDHFIANSQNIANPYKKMDLIVEAFSQMPDKKLVVVGDGPDFKKIRSKASRNVEILGYQPSGVLRELMQKSKAFVFAAEEDFGIIPVEAQACGTPVIGYGKGGLKETVIENKTGIFFKEQTVQSLIGAIAEFERKQYRFDGTL